MKLNKKYSGLPDMFNEEDISPLMIPGFLIMRIVNGEMKLRSPKETLKRFIKKFKKKK